jgi:hypothetical protein
MTLALIKKSIKVIILTTLFNKQVIASFRLLRTCKIKFISTFLCVNDAQSAKLSMN